MPSSSSPPAFWSSLALCSGFFALDSMISISAFGLYHPSFILDFDEMEQHLRLQGEYSFSRSPFDFLPLLLVRSLLIFVLLFLRFYKSFPTSNPLTNKIINLTLFGVQICNFSYSLVKFLALSDRDGQLKFPGCWINVCWGIFAAALLHAIYRFWLFSSKKTELAPVSSENDSEIRRPLLLNGVSQQSIPDSIQIHIPDQPSNRPSSQMATPAAPPITTWDHIKCLLLYCAAFWNWLLVGFTFLVIYSSVRIFIPLYTAQVISKIVRTREMTAFFHSILWMSILLGAATLFGGLRAGTLNYTTAQIERLMRRDLFRSVTNQEISFFDQSQSGEILSRLIADCETMSQTIATNLNIFLRNGLMVLGSIVFMLGMSWRLTLVTVIVIPPITFFTKLYTSLYDNLSKETQQCKANANRIAEEVVSSMRNVRAFASERKEQSRFEHELDETLKIQKKKSLALMGFLWVNELAENIILVAILAYGGYLVISEKMTSDQMFAFLLYQLQLGENFYSLNSVATGLMECVGASRKVVEYLNRRPAIPLEAGTLKPAHVRGKVEFREVNFAYPTRPNTRVLSAISFVVRPGEMVALVGPSGAGKSSVISLLERFYEPQQGQILLDDVPIEQWEHGYFHQKLSLVSQEPTLYACSIRENILYGCDEEGEFAADLEATAKLANIHQFVVDSEQGYDTKCGEKGVQMSGGQKQRIAIARALIRKPAVLILDEATSALDAESEHQIQQALQSCARGRSVLLIAHRLSTVEKANRIIVMDGGRIVQMGSHQELMSQPEGLYHSLVQRQLLGVNDKEKKTIDEE